MKPSKKTSVYLEKIGALVADTFVLILSGGLSLLVRYEFSFSRIPELYYTAWFRFLPIQILCSLLFFIAVRMYRFSWRYASLRDIILIAFFVICAWCINLVVAFFVEKDLPTSINFMMLIFQVAGIAGMRALGRLFHELLSRRGRQLEGERIMLIGAGEAGRVLLREYSTSTQVNGRICCIVDDDPAKLGKVLYGVKVVGGTGDIEYFAKKEQVTQIVFAIPSASPEVRKEILETCSLTGCKIKTLPGVYQLLNGIVSIADTKDVQVEDLLGREPVELDTSRLDEFLSGKRVLVTGGGGSIGSEICRQVAQFDPEVLVVLDIYENNAYSIQQELKRTYGDRLTLKVEIASVRDKARIDGIMEKYRPHVVFHAAAHKHVPLMEDCPSEAVKNNIFATYNLAASCEEHGVDKFVMISTDKAVNPTSFMGATKRFGEMILQSRSSSVTKFCAVRFGNVLGSNGSVVPLFKQQIEEGGPVTVTDKRIIRYFMTIPEAAQLVLEAGAMAEPGQIFVLDMGKPVKILDLAENLIRLSGLKPYEDIDIVETGLRPGEKLYEELLIASNTLSKTDNKKIFVEQQEHISAQTVTAAMQEMASAIKAECGNEELRALLKQYVTTYRSPEQVNSEAIKANADLSAIAEGDINGMGGSDQ